jgi:hypothetical protein
MKFRTAVAVPLLGLASLSTVAAVASPSPVSAIAWKYTKYKPSGVVDLNAEKCIIDWVTSTGGRSLPIVHTYWRYLYPNCAP